MSDHTSQTASARHIPRRSFVGDKRGVAAVEFGLIAPVLLIMLIGVIEVTRAVSIDRKLGKVTAMVADLLTREKQVDAATVEGIYEIVEHIMGVWGTERLKLHITPVRAAEDDRNDIYVYATKENRPSFGANPVSPRDVCDRYTALTTDLLDTNGTAIVVESELEFAPLIAEGVVPSKTWSDRAVFAPRDGEGSGCVSFKDGDEADCEPPAPC